MPSATATLRPMRLRRTLVAMTTGTALVVLGAAGLPSPAIAAARTSYTVDVTPNHGEAGDTFTATLTVSPGPCAAQNVGFYLDRAAEPGTEIGPIVQMPDSCVASLTVTVPSSWSAGTKRIYATYGDPSVPPAERGSTFTVTTPAPSPTPSKTASAPPTARPSSSATTESSPTPQPAVNSSPTLEVSTDPSTSGSRPSSSPHADSMSDDATTLPPQTRFDLASGGASGGASWYVWLVVGFLIITAMFAVMLVRRRLVGADQAEGRHRRAPGRWNASDDQ